MDSVDSASAAGAHAFRAVAIGVSTGGVHALQKLLGELPATFPLPILIVQHISADADSGLAKLLNDRCALRVKEADEQDEILPGTVYLAPPNYHLLVECDGFLALSADPYVSFARPSVDVLFESAAAVFGPGLIGIVLTGANFDGSRGLKTIKQRGGVAIVQDPADAEARQMPQAAMAATRVDYVVALAGMAALLQQLVARPGTIPRDKNGRDD
ncbi:MAG: two-component system chemotaxis family response regulator CheB [Rhodocyclaceae bacterium]|nr:MAG: two-component system chemotaxis family response regulator CheB [Rhodocyclaceae bacterium]TND00156.1 MAG: two-component system, chemotaxis family, response regulator CheB [Rhodocyclaceae bacterium]